MIAMEYESAMVSAPYSPTSMSFRKAAIAPHVPAASFGKTASTTDVRAGLTTPSKNLVSRRSTRSPAPNTPTNR